MLISGDELLPPGQPRGPGQIWESNATLLVALLQRLGYGVAERRLVADQREPLRQALLELAGSCDLVVSTGGVSAGDSDWIRALVEELGQVRFWKLFLKPGRPFAWGQVAGVPFFGLPGNPVAGVANGTVIFVLPGSLDAVQTAWDRLIRAQLDVSTKPCNLVALLPRLLEPETRAAGSALTPD